MSSIIEHEDEKKTSADTPLNLGTVTELFERESQLEALEDAYMERNQTVLITGAPGTGKSTLAESLRKRVENEGGFFLSGKLDEAIHKPYAPFLAAMEDFVRQVQSRGDDMVKAIQKESREAIGSELLVLIDAVPDLAVLSDGEFSESASEEFSLGGGSMSDSSSEFNFQATENQNRAARFTSVFCRFLRAISKNDRPLVILLDDLQWADESTLAMLEALRDTMLVLQSDSQVLTAEEEEDGLMVIGTCRDNDMTTLVDLAATLRRIEDRGTAISQIMVANLTLDGMSRMISKILDLPESECLSLVEFIQAQTEGNVFFARQYLRSLAEEGILYKEEDTEKWTWDETALLMTLPSDTSAPSILQLLTKKLQQLPKEVVDVLIVASCMGSRFSEALLSRTGMVISSQVLSSLEVAVDHGFIAYDFDEDRGRWMHDCFKEAAYSLLPDNQKATYHLAIGRNWRRQLSIADVKKHILLIVNQIKLGLELVTSEGEKDDFARLFLKAGKEAGKNAAFIPAAQYVNLGITLLGFRHWRDQYELSLDLKSTAAELAFCIGKHDQVEDLATEIMANAWTTQDKLRAIMVQMAMCSANGDSDAGLEIGLGALEELKEPLSLRGGKIRLIFEFLRLKSRLNKTSEETILALPELEDQRILASMQVLYMVFRTLIASAFQLSPLVAFRIVRMTLNYGLSPMAGVGFLFFAAGLMRLGDVENGYRFGQLGYRLLKRYNPIKVHARMEFVFWGVIQPMKEPLRVAIEPMWKSYRLGLKVGDVEMGLLSAAAHCNFRLILGDPIDEIVRILVRVRSVAIAANNSKAKSHISLILQACDNFRGLSKNALVMTGAFMNEQEMMEQAVASKSHVGLQAVMHMKYMIAVYTMENNYAKAMYDANKQVMQSFAFPTLAVAFQFFRALVATALARDTTGLARRRNLRDAKQMYKKLNRLLAHCPDNVVNKLNLIDAELEFCRGRFTTALLKYDQSISSAERQGITCETALACEKAGLMLRSAGRGPEATDYFQRAKVLYQRWGAQVKVEALDGLLKRP